MAESCSWFYYLLQVSIEVNESSLAACYCQEVATILLSFSKPSEARIYFQRAAELQLQVISDCSIIRDFL